MEAFLPSEIGRLIYGYLLAECDENLANEFLNSCDTMRECRLLKQKYAKNFHYKVQDLSLEDILNQYSVMCSLIFKNIKGEQPVHRNALNLLQKLLTFKLGRSSSASNQAHAAHPVVTNKQSSCYTESENRYDSVVGVSCVLAPSNNDAQNKNVSPVDKITEKNSVGDPSIIIVDVSTADINSNETFLGNMSFGSDYQLLDEVTYFSPGMKLVKQIKSLPGSKSSPCQSEMISASNTAVMSLGDMVKTLNSVDAIKMNVPMTVMKSIYNVSKNVSSIVKCHSSNKFECSAFSRGSVSEVSEENKLLSFVNKTTPLKSPIISAETVTVSVIKTPRIHTSVAPMVSAIETSITDLPEMITHKNTVAKIPFTSASIMSFTEVLATAVTVSDITAVSSTGVPGIHVAEAPTIAASMTNATEIPMSLTVNVPAPLVPLDSILEIPITMASPVVNVAHTPTTITSVVNMPEVSTSTILSSGGSVFGNPSFSSEFNIPAVFNETISRLKSTVALAEPTKKVNLPQPGSEVAPRKAAVTILPATKITPKKSEITNLSTTKLTPKKSEVGCTNTTATVLTNEITETYFSDDELPWDLNLRLFVASDSSVDEHVTKRKPKVLSKKRKETPKKRKRNDSFKELTSDAKRFKFDAMKSVASKLADIDENVELKSNSLRHRRHTENSEVSLDHDVLSRRIKSAKSRNEDKIVLGPVTSMKPPVSMGEIIDMWDPKIMVTEKMTKQVGSLEKPMFKELREPVSSRNIQPTATVNDGNDFNYHSVDETKSDRVGNLVVKNKNLSMIDQKNSTFKYPNLPCLKESNVLSSKEPLSNNNNCQKYATNDKCDSADNAKAIELLKDYCQPSINEKEEKISDSRSDDDLNLEMVLEISPEFELFYRASQC